MSKFRPAPDFCLFIITAYYSYLTFADLLLCSWLLYKIAHFAGPFYSKTQQNEPLAHRHDRQLFFSEYPKITLTKCSDRYPLSLKLELRNC